VNKNRIEAFSDGVFAIIVTIMVLELKRPEGVDPAALHALGVRLFSYLLSFVFVAIYWVNHHHMFQTVEQIEGKTLWHNLHLLFWLTLVPFGTAWLTAGDFGLFPVLFYGLVLLGAALAYFFLARSLAQLHGPRSRLAQALGEDFKGKLSAGVYVVALPLAFVNPWIPYGLYILVALIWLVPDSRFEKKLKEKGSRKPGGRP
jgi:uncharacterized membrane protein